MWEGLAGFGRNALDFLKTGAGQTLGGAALGAGVSELTGGDWETGAALGGLAGLGNAYSSGGGFGGDTWTGSSLDNAMAGSGMFGQPGQQYQTQASKAATDLGRAFTPAESTALQQGYEGLAANQPMGLAGMYDKYKGPVDLGLKGYETYSKARDASKKSDLAQREIDEQAKINAYNIAQAKDADRRRRQTGTGAREGFAASSMFR